MLLWWIPLGSLLFRTRPVVLLLPGVRERHDVDIAIAVTAIVITLVLVIGGIVGPASPPDQIPPDPCSPLCRLLP